jgi:uroporphyrinogen decarboxylase
MTPRERIKKALSHERPDRLPRYEIFLGDFVTKWRRETNAAPNADIYAHYAKIDIGTILATQEGPFLNQKMEREDGDCRYVRDSWGRLTRHRKNAKFFQVLDTAVKDKADLDRLQFGDPSDPQRPDLAGLEPWEKKVRDRFAPVGGVMGLFMPSYYLRGEINLLTDLADDAPFCHALIGRVADFIGDLGERVLERTNTWDTALWVYDDFGTNRGPLISPATFERFFLPPYRRIISQWKSKGARNVILHFDANCWSILDLLIEAGFTGIQGIYPGANMSIPAVKAKVGRKLALIGGVCNIKVLAPGPKASIERAVASIVEVAQDGGVVIGAHSIDEDIPVEHYDHYYSLLDACDEAW